MLVLRLHKTASVSLNIRISFILRVLDNLISTRILPLLKDETESPSGEWT